LVWFYFWEADFTKPILLPERLISKKLMQYAMLTSTYIPKNLI